MTATATSPGSGRDVLPHSVLVLVSYNELVDFDPVRPNTALLSKIETAFGARSDALGILAVTDVPDFPAKRATLLPLAQQLANLPDNHSLECPDALYSVGWSHGREVLANGRPDTYKGSFYANPLTDTLVDDLMRHSANPERNEQYWQEQCTMHPAFYADNVWPSASLPALRPAVRDMGQLLVHVGCRLAQVCDVYCATHGVVGTIFHQQLSASRNCKVRLLHYFAQDQGPNKEKGNDLWCGWHNDHGSLTGLVPGMFFDATTGQVVETPLSSTTAGLWIQARNGIQHRVTIPVNACAFQMGETLQIQSGGLLRATPHAVVMPTNAPNVTRASFACFIEPEFLAPLIIPADRSLADCQAADAPLPPGVLPLSRRWQPGQCFGDFHVATVTAFCKRD